MKVSKSDHQSRRGGLDRLHQVLWLFKNPSGSPRREDANRSCIYIMIKMMGTAQLSRTPRGSGYWRSRCPDARITTERRQSAASSSWPGGFRRRPPLHPNPAVSRDTLGAQACLTPAHSEVTLGYTGLLTAWAGCLFLSPASWSTLQRRWDVCPGNNLPPSAHSPSPPRYQPRRGPPVSPMWTVWPWRMSPWTSWQSPSKRAARTKDFSEIKDEYVL